ncbi:MAG: hypothetical protein E5W44_25390, partial [Mesorhizobium sp.]
MCLRHLAVQRLAPLPAFRYRAATRVDTLGGNAEEGRPGLHDPRSVWTAKSVGSTMQGRDGFRRLR